VYNAAGNIVTVQSFNLAGNWTLSSQPVSYPVALVYLIKIKQKDVDQVPIASIISSTVEGLEEHIADGSIHFLEAEINITKSQVTDFPTIPTKVSDLTDDVGLITDGDTVNCGIFQP
jgi:hypothetical protein